MINTDPFKATNLTKKISFTAILLILVSPRQKRDCKKEKGTVLLLDSAVMTHGGAAKGSVSSER